MSGAETIGCTIYNVLRKPTEQREQMDTSATDTVISLGILVLTPKAIGGILS